jgi:hypothetical protein
MSKTALYLYQQNGNPNENHNIMKKNIFIITLFCHISIFAQNSVDSTNVLTAIKKDYLYNLTQINTNTILIIDPYQKNVQFPSAIAKTLNIKLQIKETDNLSFTIREKEECKPLKEMDNGYLTIQEKEGCNPYRLSVSVYFIVLKSTNGFSKKSGDGDFISKAPDSYRWVLKGDILIFIFTRGFRQLSNTLQRYVYLPAAE